MIDASLQQQEQIGQFEHPRFATGVTYGVSGYARSPLRHQWIGAASDIKTPRFLHVPMPVSELIAGVVLAEIDSTIERNLGDEYGRNLQSRITDLLKHHRHQDWDGEDADPLSEDTVSVACKIAACFPDRVPTDVNATPHGEVDFDWVVNRKTMLTVSVGPPPKHIIAYAAIFDGERVSGQATWSGTLPRLIRCCFRQLITK